MLAQGPGIVSYVADHFQVAHLDVGQSSQALDEHR